MASLKQMENQKSYLELASEFCSRHIRTLFVFIGFVVSLLGLLFLEFPSKNFLLKDLQVYVYVFVFILFLVNLYFVYLNYRKKELPEILTNGKNAYTILLLLIAVCSFCLPKWFGFQNQNGSIFCLIITIILCLVNYKLTKSYRSNWNMPHDLLSKLVRIEGLGLFIAVMQLFIAFPQIKAAYDQLENKDVNNLKESLETFNKHLESAVIVDIPDSLMNENVAKARKYQKELFAYSLFLSHCNLEPFSQENDINKDSILSSKKLTKKEEFAARLTLNWLTFNNQMTLIEDALERFRATHNCITNLSKLLNIISETYEQEDSLMLDVQVSRTLTERQLITCNKLKEIVDIVENHSGSIRMRIHERIECTKKSTPEQSLRLIEDCIEDTEILKSEIVGLLSCNELLDIINISDELCLQYIHFLNLVQLKYAYGVNYTGAPLF